MSKVLVLIGVPNAGCSAIMKKLCQKYPEIEHVPHLTSRPSREIHEDKIQETREYLEELPAEEFLKNRVFGNVYATPIAYIKKLLHKKKLCVLDWLLSHMETLFTRLDEKQLFCVYIFPPSTRYSKQTESIKDLDIRRRHAQTELDEISKHGLPEYIDLALVNMPNQLEHTTDTIYEAFIKHL